MISLAFTRSGDHLDPDVNEGGYVRTVLGDRPTRSLGIVLFHEHLSSDMSPWIGDLDYCLLDADETSAELAHAKALGVGCIVDATTADVGRRPEDLVAAAVQSGVHVVAAAGLYRELTFPDFVRFSQCTALASFFIRDIVEGIEGSGAKAGVLGEVGTANVSMSRSEEIVLRAVAIAALETGVPIITHTSGGGSAVQQLQVLSDMGVPASRVVIGHLDGVSDPAIRVEVASRGAYVGLDRVGLDSYATDESRLQAVLDLCAHGFLDRILLSSDVARRSRLRSGGGRGYGGYVMEFTRQLRNAGMRETELAKLLVANPARFLTLGSAHEAS